MDDCQPDSSLLEEAVRRLVQAFGPERIYLFGSQARGDAAPDSDYDILVVVPDSDQPRHLRTQRAYQALSGLRVPFDVIVLTRQEFERELGVASSLAATVERDGLLLYAI